MTRPLIIGVGGVTSDAGKTTLMCELLRAFPSWEAIKTTRGHYRSCGKDPHACCVSHLLDDAPVIRSGRELTYSAGKDTGRYWDAGASNVHWVIATNEQLEDGIKEAIRRVRARGVFVEGNSFSKYIEPDFFVMVARGTDSTVKASARDTLKRTSAIYLSSGDQTTGMANLRKLLSKAHSSVEISDVPVFSPSNLPQLLNALSALEPAVAA